MSSNYMQFFSPWFLWELQRHMKKKNMHIFASAASIQWADITVLFCFLMFWMIWRLAWVFNKKYNFKLHAASWCQNSAHRLLRRRPPARHWEWWWLVIWLCKAGRWNCKQCVLRQAILEKTSVLNMVSIFFFKSSNIFSSTVRVSKSMWQIDTCSKEERFIHGHPKRDDNHILVFTGRGFYLYTSLTTITTYMCGYWNCFNVSRMLRKRSKRTPPWH